MLAALYLEEVAAADRKIGEIDGLLREHAESSSDQPPITVVTARSRNAPGANKKCLGMSLLWTTEPFMCP